MNNHESNQRRLIYLYEEHYLEVEVVRKYKWIINNKPK